MTNVRISLEQRFPMDWQMRRRYRLPSDDPQQPYYVYWSPQPQPRGEGWEGAAHDDRGVLLSQGKYHPVRIAQYGLHHHDLAVSGNSRSLQTMLAQARYLATAQGPDGSYRYADALRDFSAGPGWMSAMAQGQACSLLVRAFASTGEAAFAEAASRAAQPLRTDVSEGGASYIRGGDVFFEEVAVASPCHILNGHLYAAFGVWDLERFGLADRRLIDAHVAAVSTLKAWLPRFDADGWSYYHLGADKHGARAYAAPSYHQFHIAQLRVYAAMTATPGFEVMAQRWETSLTSSRVRLGVWARGVGQITKGLFRRLGLAEAPVWQQPLSDAVSADPSF